MKQRITTYVVADTHFYHSAIRKYCHRPDNCDEIIIKNLENTLRESDILIHLGDVIFYNSNVNSLNNGNKLPIDILSPDQ